MRNRHLEASWHWRSVASCAWIMHEEATKLIPYFLASFAFFDWQATRRKSLELWGSFTMSQKLALLYCKRTFFCLLGVWLWRSYLCVIPMTPHFLAGYIQCGRTSPFTSHCSAYDDILLRELLHYLSQSVSKAENSQHSISLVIILSG